MGRSKSGLERMVGGLTAGVLVGVAWYLHLLPGGVLIFLGVFFGLLPFLSGVRRAVSELVDNRQKKQSSLEDRRTMELERKDSLEKTILQIAKERKGIVTPTQVVLRSDLKLEEAEKALQDLAARGYAEMRIKDNGTIDYVFHDLT